MQNYSSLCLLPEQLIQHDINHMHLEIEILGHSYRLPFPFPHSSCHSLVQNVSQQPKHPAIFASFRWELLRDVCIESSQRLTVCTSTNQSQESSDSGLYHFIGVVLVAFCQRHPSLLSWLFRLSGTSDPGYFLNICSRNLFRINCSV